jgi:threonine dehydratase
MRKSIEAGERVTVTPGPTLADALLIAQPGEHTFEVVRRLVDEVVVVDEDEIRAAVKFLAEEQKLVVEGGGAVGVAALRNGKVAAGGLPVVCILSGGNILPGDLAAILAA